MTNINDWTAQRREPLDHVPVYPGQVLSKDELPDPTVQDKAGIDPEGWKLASPTSLFVEGDPALKLNTVRAFATGKEEVKSVKPVATGKEKLSTKHTKE